MKKIFLLICLCTSSLLIGQTTLTALKVSLTEAERTALEWIEILELSLDLSIAYPSDLLPEAKKKIRLKAKDEPVEKVLQQIFAGQYIQCKLSGKRLLITKAVRPPEKKTINGYIRNQEDGEVLIGATVLVVGESSTGTSTNVYGYYSLSLPEGKYDLEVSYLGFDPKRLAVDLSNNQRLDIELEPSSAQLMEVVVTSEQEKKQLTSTEMGVHNLNIQQLKTLPSIGGEPDVLKMLQLLPGVKNVGEGSSGLYVRGGNIDQNLILLDEAPVYNPGHLLGFFSAFNTDAIRHVEMYKAGFPVEYGGRLSSVVDLRMKEGNKEKMALEGGIGLLVSRLHLEGPLQKEKSSFMLSARRTYPDLFFLFANDSGGNKIHFYDVNAKANVELNQNNHLYFSTYLGQDVFRFFDQYENRWGNNTATLRWNHIFNDRSFANFSLVYSDYDYYIDNFIEGSTTFNWESGVRDINLKADFTHYISPGSTLKFGWNTILHHFEPGQDTEGRLLAVPDSKALESALYAGHELSIGERLKVDYGLRFSMFNNLGKTRYYEFDEAFEVADSVLTNGGIYHTLSGFSPRLNLRYQLSDNASLKASYARTLQFQQELRNAVNSFSAFYIWMPSGPNVPEQKADQVALGYYQNFGEDRFEFSIETYYKWLHNQVDFADHAALIQNPFLEGQLRLGEGRAYGLEFFLAKRKGRLNGWLSYTYSRTLRTINAVNQGKEYPAYFDIPHSAKLVLQYELSKRWSLAANWQYATGKAVNLPVGSYQLGQSIVPLYGERNGTRLPDFHRLDLSATLHRKVKPDRKNESYWVFSLYNVFYRKNALSIDLQPRREQGTGNVPDPTDVVALKTYIFGLIPSVSYNFKF